MNNRPSDRPEPVYEYSETGFLIPGPQLAQPGWYRDAEPGKALRSNEVPGNVLSRQKHQKQSRVSRYSRLLAALRGQPTRNKAA